MLYHTDTGKKEDAHMDTHEIKEQDEFWSTFLALRENPIIQELKKYPNHKISNLYDHSSRVARRLHLPVNEKSLAKGAMLHDFYLYQARGNKTISVKEHWFGHPITALENAEKEFDLTDLEKNIITSHMWPLTFFHVPKSREALLVGLADKICAFGERVLKQNHIKNLRKYENRK
jgi:uncharacterized protein